MSQSATPATRNEATRSWKTRKVTPFAELTIGTANGPHADGCGRLRTVAQRLANTAQPPHPQSETGTLATHSGKIWSHKGHISHCHEVTPMSKRVPRLPSLICLKVVESC